MRAELSTASPGRVAGLAASLRVARVQDSAELPQLAQAWEGLLDPSSPAAVFDSAAWLLPWWNRFGTGKRLCTYTAHLGSRLVGVLPAYHARTPLGGWRLRLLGDGRVGSDHLGVVAQPDDREMVAAAFARALVEHEADLAFEGLAGTDPLVGALKLEARRADMAVSVTRLARCPFLSIMDAGDFSTWLDQRPSGAGAQLVRRRRWLANRPGFRTEILVGERDVLSALPMLWRLHRARWATSGGSQAVPNASCEQFQYESARELARRGWARLYVLHVEGAPRAALCGFERGGRFAYYQSGSDPDWRQRWVGRAVLGLALEDAFRRRLTEFDFLRGHEHYKYLFASGAREVVRVRAATASRARLLLTLAVWDAAGQQLAREVAPDDMVDWLRRWRRKARRWLAN